MVQKPLAAILLAGLCCGARAFELPSAGDGQHVSFESDSASYDRQNDVLHLSGHVTVKEEGTPDGKTLKSEDLVIYPSSSVAVSSGPVTLEDSEGAVSGENGFYDWEAKEGRLENSSAVYGPWRVLGAESAEIKEGLLIYRRLSLTSCAREFPHYRFRAGKLFVRPGRRLWGTNAVFYLGAVPVFYFPVIYRPLGTDNAYVTYLAADYDKRNGVAVKTTTVYDFNSKATAKLFADYFTRKNFGAGFELNYNDPENFRGNVTAYRIKEPGGQNRWGVAGGHWQKLKDDYTVSPVSTGAVYYAQSRFRLVSDPFFNNDFFRTNPYAVSSDRQASFALVRQSSFLTARASYKRDDVRRDDASFYKSYESRPRLDFQTSPFTVLGIPLLNSCTGYFDSSYSTETARFTQTAGARWTVSRPFGFSGLAFTPSVFYEEGVIFSSHTASGERDEWSGLWGYSFNARKNTALAALDLNHNYAVRTGDGGVEKNLLSFESLSRPTTSFYLKFASAYDLREIPGAKFDDRLQPLTGELVYNPRPATTIIAQDGYKAGDGNQWFLVQAEAGSSGGLSGGLGFSNYKSSPKNYVLNQRLGFRPPEKSWGFDLSLGCRAVVASGPDFEDFALFSKSFTLYKDFHDFKTEWRLTLRPGVRAFSFKANLRFASGAEQSSSRRRAEQLWYPWRRGAERD